MYNRLLYAQVRWYKAIRVMKGKQRCDASTTIFQYSSKYIDLANFRNPDLICIAQA